MLNALKGLLQLCKKGCCAVDIKKRQFVMYCVKVRALHLMLTAQCATWTRAAAAIVSSHNTFCHLN